MFVLIKTDLSGNTIWPQALGFQKLAKLTIFGIFNELLSTQNVNVARFARNVECNFFCDFQTLWCCYYMIYLSQLLLDLWSPSVTLKILKEWIEDEGGSWFINGMPWILVGDQPFPSPKNGSDDAQYAHKYYLNFRANFVRLWSLRISGQTLILQDAILLLVMWSLMCRKTASHASHFRLFFQRIFRNAKYRRVYAATILFFLDCKTIDT